MSLIDKLEDLVIKVDTEYQQKMEAVIREIVPGMPEGNVRHAAECMCTDRMGSMMDIDIYIGDYIPFYDFSVKWYIIT